MKKAGRLVGLIGMIVLGAFFWTLSSIGEAATINVNCSTGGVLQTAIDGALSGDTISVTGTCTEYVVIRHGGITIDGNGTAAIVGPGNTSSTVFIWDRDTTIRNFASISGGQDGIVVYFSGLQQ